MRLSAMALGLMAWTAAIAVPALYAALIALAAGVSRHAPEVGFSTDELMPSINRVPGMIWLYSIATALIGLVLVLRGFGKPDSVDDTATTV